MTVDYQEYFARERRLTACARHLKSSNPKAVARRLMKHRDPPMLIAGVVLALPGIKHPATRHGAEEFVTLEALAATADQWNSRPILIDHPMRGAEFIGCDAAVLAESCVGQLHHVRIMHNALVGTAYLVRAALRHRASFVLTRLLAGAIVPVSIGAHVRARRDGTWVTARPDHLALLPDVDGADDAYRGCGLQLIEPHRRSGDQTIRSPVLDSADHFIYRGQLFERISDEEARSLAHRAPAEHIRPSSAPASPGRQPGPSAVASERSLSRPQTRTESILRQAATLWERVRARLTT